MHKGWHDLGAKFIYFFMRITWVPNDNLLFQFSIKKVMRVLKQRWEGRGGISTIRQLPLGISL